MSPVKKVHEAIMNCEANLAVNYDGAFRLPKKAENPFKLFCIPESDISPDLEPNAVSNFQTVISIHRW